VKIGRPKFHPGYAIETGDEGLLPWSFVEERLASAHNYWIVTNSGGAAPQTSPMWGLWLDGAFVFGTNPHSPKARNLSRDPRAVVHLESGDEVVMLHGRVEALGTAELPLVLDEYERKYATRLEPGDGWFALRPSYVHAWREADYQQSATRFDL
jgi:hypothetical protein